MTGQVQTQISVSTDVSGLDSLTIKFSEIVALIDAEAVLGAVGALPVTLVSVQFIKGVIKHFCGSQNEKTRRIRRGSFFLTSLIMGFFWGLFFTGMVALSVVIAFINPYLYMFLCRWAYAHEKYALLATLKGRKLRRDESGDLTLEETQEFHHTEYNVND